MYFMAMILNAIILEKKKLYYYCYANIHLMVIVVENKIKVFFFFFFGQIDRVLLMTMGPSPPPPKMLQLSSNLFISVISNNEGIFFHCLSRVSRFFSNLTKCC
jgi:hypothetical protein